MAGGQEIRDVVIKLRTDASGVVKGNQEAQRSFDGLKGVGLALGAGMGIAAGAVAALISQIDRGQGVSELTNSFRNLQEQSGGSAAALGALREATQGLISDTDLMAASNQALLAGLSPDQFQRVATAADTLGDAVGVNTKTAMDQLTMALTTGNERLLKQYGILIDNKKAEEDFAKSIGTTADKLNESGKREAARIAILEKMEEQTKKLGSANDTAGDALQRVRVNASNLFDRFAQAINESSSLTFEMNRLANALDSVANSADPAKRELKALEEQMSALRKAQDRDLSTVPFQLQEKFAQGASAASARLGQLQGFKDFLETNKLLSDVFVELNGRIEKFGPASRNTADELEKVTQLHDEYNKFVSDNASDSLKANFEKSLAAGNFEAAEDFRAQYAGAVDKMADAYFAKFVEAGIQVTEEDRKNYIDRFIIPMSEKQAEAQKKMSEKQAEAQKKAFQDTVSFFEDILTTSITGSSQSIEEILKDALKRVAIGFGGQLLAEITGSLGGSGGILSSIKDAKGFGEELAKLLTGGGDLSSLLGKGASNIGPVANGADYASSLSSSATSLSSISTSLTAMLPAAAAVAGVAFTWFGSQAAKRSGSGWDTAWNTANAMNPVNQGINAVQGGQEVLHGGRLTQGQQIALALPTFGLSFAVNPAMDAFGISSGNPLLAAEREWREGMLAQLAGEGNGPLSIKGTRGPITFDPKNYNIDTSNSHNAEATGLASPLSHILTNGDDKQSSDLAAIFANGLKEGQNFNEMIVNAQALMDTLGINAEEAKGQVTSLFLDGKISLDEFTADLANLNILAQEDLVGPNSVSDAIKILGDNIDKNPRVALKGLGLVFKELKDQGIDTTQEIHDFIALKYPELTPIFDQLGAAGIDTFEEIKNASDDQIAQIFNIIKPLSGAFGDAADSTLEVGDNSEISAQKTERSAERMVKAWERVERAAKGAGIASADVGA